MPKCVGILGGMGPKATAYFYQLLIDETPATCDQDHIPTLIYSLPQIPDRTQCILTQDHSYIQSLLTHGLMTLEKAGADIIVIPCNTVHYYYEYMNSQTQIPIVNMINEVFDYCHHHVHSSIALLATSGTIQSNLYQSLFQSKNPPLFIPDLSAQDDIMTIIMFFNI